ncbi:hypothetical protein [Dactylosporangium fulvum]|uniref:Uncharacterized protein n=1 Tax=Dactylosporangium fulvum TaxID=53359 RepID=A0ABY5W4T0_9ACTN|nr:hypothetical protein [Dactylosporangium fulvum]UWP84459.1 hypothetical protein Dfulv_09570 [Dactylosporangium fulvum]
MDFQPSLARSLDVDVDELAGPVALVTADRPAHGSAGRARPGRCSWWTGENGSPTGEAQARARSAAGLDLRPRPTAAEFAFGVDLRRGRWRSAVVEFVVGVDFGCVQRRPGLCSVRGWRRPQARPVALGGGQGRGRPRAQAGSVRQPTGFAGTIRQPSIVFSLPAGQLHDHGGFVLPGRQGTSKIVEPVTGRRHRSGVVTHGAQSVRARIPSAKDISDITVHR